MERKFFDLINFEDSTEVYEFVKAVAALAIGDWQDDVKKNRTGKEICNMFTIAARKGHERMATGIYNNVRWTLDLRGK